VNCPISTIHERYKKIEQNDYLFQLMLLAKAAISGSKPHLKVQDGSGWIYHSWFVLLFNFPPEYRSFQDIELVHPIKDESGLRLK